MNSLFAQVKGLATRAIQKAKVRKGLLWTLAVLFVLQVYFVRELLAAELLFGLGFLAVLGLVGFCYAIGTLGERGLQLTESGARAWRQNRPVAVMPASKKSVKSNSAINIQSLRSSGPFFLLGIYIPQIYNHAIVRPVLTWEAKPTGRFRSGRVFTLNQ